MKKFWQKLSPQQFFWLFLPISLLLAVVVVYVSGRDYINRRQCGCSPLESEPKGEFDYSEEQAFFDNHPVVYPLAEIEPGAFAQAPIEDRVLGEISDERWIEIDLSDQRLYAHEGNRVIYNFLVSTGKPWTPTVTGEFRVWIKIRYTKMSGGSRAQGNYYYLPNVPFVQYFYRGYGLHGTYWHSNFGQTMSHGCVNLRTPDAEKLFYWTSPPVPSGRWVVYPSQEYPGTRIVIHQ